MTNPCKQCIIISMCGEACSKYVDYIGLCLEKYTCNEPIVYIAQYLIAVRPNKYFLCLYLKDNKDSVNQYTNYALLLDGTTIIGLESIINIEEYFDRDDEKNE